MTPRCSIFIFVAMLSIGGGVFHAAQKALKVDVDLVMVNIAVTDSDNRSVTDLKAENFHVFEDKFEQQIRYFASEAAPMSLGIVFDMSHSMERKLDFAKDAAVKFLEKGTPDDEYFLVEFSTRAKLAEGFTESTARQPLAYPQPEPVDICVTPDLYIPLRFRPGRQRKKSGRPSAQG